LSRELIVAAWDGGTAGALLDDAVLLDWTWAPADGAHEPGAIHLARIARLRADLGLAFVTLGGGAEAAFDLRSATYREGDGVLVQVAAAARDGKPARVRARPALVGHFVVLRRSVGPPPPAGATAATAASAAGARPESVVAVPRSAATDADPARVGAECARLAALWNRIAADAARLRAPVLLHAQSAACRAALPLLRARPGRVLVADRRVALDLASLGVDAGIEDVAQPFDICDVATQLGAAQAPVVDLPGGGSLAIERTRALAAIDVDGAGSGDPADVNLRAAREIARQLRLRDLRGTIIVDFLRTGEASRRRVAETLASATAIDRRRIGLLGWTRGGLYEMRRSEDLDER
jgi:Ribonuclease G/E